MKNDVTKATGEVQENVMSPSEKMLVYELLGKAMGEVGAIKKDKDATNMSGKKMYSFRGIDDVYNAINPVFAKYGLFIIPEILEKVREEREREGNKGVLIYSLLTVKFTIYGPDGSSVSGTTVGEAMDTGDKSMNKAMSAALKYFLFQSLLIPTEELVDPDKDVYDDVGPRRLPSRRNDNPPAKGATVEKTDTLPPQANQQEPPAGGNGNPPPKPPVNPVVNYLKNEQRFMMGRLGITDDMAMTAKFAKWRKELIASGAVEDIPSKNLTMEQAHALCEAIYKTFLSEDSVEE